MLSILGPRLDPRPWLGGGDEIRIGGASILAALRCELEWIRSRGIAGTGGASTALGTCRAGEGSRNVRSDIDPLLPLRSSSVLGFPPTELPIDDVEPDLRIVLFV